MQKTDHKVIPHWIWWLAVLVILAVALRVLVWFTYQPQQTSDAEGYILMANMIYTRRFFINFGARPPFYPALITWLAMSKYGLNERIVWLFQAALGVLGSCLWFWAGWKLTRKNTLAFLAGLPTAINLSLIFFEPLVMTEVISAFILLLTLIIIGLLGEGKKPGWIRSVLLGLLVGIAALTRPLFQYLGLIYILYLWLRSAAESVLKRISLSLAYLIPLACLILGWSYFNWQTTRYFGVTTMTGFNLINHTGAFIEAAPPQYAAVQEVYLKYRAERIAETGNQSMTIWRALPDLGTVTGLSYVELSKLLTRMSVDLIIRRPDLYLISVANAWLGFWKVPNYWYPASIQPAVLASCLKAVWLVERITLIGVNFVFLAFGVYWIYRLFQRRLSRIEVSLLWLWWVVFGASLIQALLDYGENPRYGLPFESLIGWVVLVGVWLLWQRKSAGSKESHV